MAIEHTARLTSTPCAPWTLLLCTSRWRFGTNCHYIIIHFAVCRPDVTFSLFRALIGSSNMGGGLCNSQSINIPASSVVGSRWIFISSSFREACFMARDGARPLRIRPTRPSLMVRSNTRYALSAFDAYPLGLFYCKTFG